MELIEAVNLCLTMSGFDPVSSLTSASSDAGRAKDTIQRVRRRILSIGFDFNTNVVSLAVDTDGRVPIPVSYLRYELPKTDSGKLLTQKIHQTNSQLYVWHVENNDWHDELVEDVKVIFDVEESKFKYIPDAFAEWIAYESAVEYVRERKTNVDPLLIQKAELSCCKAMSTQSPRDFNITTGAHRRLAGFYAHTGSINADLIAE